MGLDSGPRRFEKSTMPATTRSATPPSTLPGAPAPLVARRRAALGALTSLGALTLAACGGGGTGSTSSASSSEAGLSGLSLSAGTLVPQFATATLGYTTAVSHSVTSISFTPTLVDTSSTLRIAGTLVGSGQTSGAFALDVGNNSFQLVVTAADGTTTKTYTVVVARASASISADASLSALSISSGVLSPQFSSAVTSYATTVAYGVTSVTLTPTTTSGSATVKVNGSSVGSGSASGALALNVGSNTLGIVVTAEDGVTQQTTTVTVVRASASAAADATLSALVVSSGTLSPAFGSGTLAYVTTVPYATASITVTPTATQANAVITIQGNTVASGSSSSALALAVGNNTIAVVVSAADGSSVTTYTLSITRAPAVSNVATLSGLDISAGALSPAFAIGTTSYTASVANGVSSLTLTPTATSSGASIRVNGVTVASGNASTALALAVGSNTLSVVVTAQDGATTATYTVLVSRASAAVSSVATLSALVLSSGTLTPVFASGTASYTASVEHATTTVTLTPTSTSALASIQVNSATVASGAASGALALSVGLNTLTVKITAQDGATTQTYTVGVTRAADSGEICPAGVVPEETAGPYPADGSTASNATYNVLALSGIVRSDIRTTLGSATAVSGVPMTVRIRLVNLNNNCAPLAGYAIYLWHCTPSGVYSVYTEKSVNSNYLRGVQVTDSSGYVGFTTVVPGCYSGRMPHMHFEVYPSLAKATSASNKIRTSQLAFPTATMQSVYSNSSGYANSVSNLANISFATDNVFSDGYALEMVTLTGNLVDGYTATVTVALAL